jgi:hypothetical protein
MTSTEADENEREFLEKCRKVLEEYKRQPPAPMSQYERD